MQPATYVYIKINCKKYCYIYEKGFFFLSLFQFRVLWSTSLGISISIYIDIYIYMYIVINKTVRPVLITLWENKKPGFRVLHWTSANEKGKRKRSVVCAPSLSYLCNSITRPLLCHRLLSCSLHCAGQLRPLGWRLWLFSIRQTQYSRGLYVFN